MGYGVDLICKIIATAVAASREAVKQLKSFDESDLDIDDALEETVESKSLNAIVNHLSTNFPHIKFKSKENVIFLKFSLMIFIKLFNFQIKSNKSKYQFPIDENQFPIDENQFPIDENAKEILIECANSIDDKHKLLLNEITQSEVYF